MTQDLLEVIEDGVAVLTLNRPDRLNAMSGSMLNGHAIDRGEIIFEGDPRRAFDDEEVMRTIRGSYRKGPRRISADLPGQG